MGHPVGRLSAPMLLTDLLCMLMLYGGCAPSSPTLPEIDGKPVHAAFGAVSRIKNREIVVQGIFRMTADERMLAVVLPHGRTLGICRYDPVPELSDAMRMNCVPASGIGASGARFLRHLGTALYTLWPALDPDAADAESIRHRRHEANGIFTDFCFTETSHP